MQITSGTVKFVCTVYMLILLEFTAILVKFMLVNKCAQKHRHIQPHTHTHTFPQTNTQTLTRDAHTNTDTQTHLEAHSHTIRQKTRIRSHPLTQKHAHPIKKIQTQTQLRRHKQTWTQKDKH